MIAGSRIRISPGRSFVSLSKTLHLHCLVLVQPRITQDNFQTGLKIVGWDVKPQPKRYQSYLSIASAMDMVRWFLSLDLCFDLQKKANSDTFPVEMEANSFQSIPAGTLNTVGMNIVHYLR